VLGENFAEAVYERVEEWKKPSAPLTKYKSVDGFLLTGNPEARPGVVLGSLLIRFLAAS